MLEVELSVVVLLGWVVVLVLVLPEMLPDVFAPEVVPDTPVLLAEPAFFSTLIWSLTFNLPAYCSAIFLAASFSFFDGTVPVSSTSLSFTVTLMFALLSVGSFFNAFWICVCTSPLLLLVAEVCDDVPVCALGVCV